MHADALLALRILVSILFVVDAAVTIWALSHRKVKEANGLLAWLMTKIGTAPAQIGIKLLPLWLIWRDPMPAIVVAVIAVGYIYLIVRNVRVILDAHEA